jgi:DNA-binding transcriptional MerR regulator
VPAAPAVGSEGAQALDDDERRRRAHLLRITGMSYADIARQLGYSTPHAAYRAVARSLASGERVTSAEWERAIETLRAQGYSLAMVAAAVREREERESRAADPGPRPKGARRTKRMKSGELPPLPTLPLPSLPSPPPLPSMPTDAPAAPRAETAEKLVP